MLNYPEIGEAINEYMDMHKLKYTRIAERIYERLGYGDPSGCWEFMRHVKAGSIYGTTSSKGSKNPRTLQKLSIFLEALGLEKSHPIITMVHAATEEAAKKLGAAKGFVYPPPKDLTLEKIVA